MLTYVNQMLIFSRISASLEPGASQTWRSEFRSSGSDSTLFIRHRQQKKEKRGSANIPQNIYKNNTYKKAYFLF
jgi:hypothetical protein